MTTKALLKRWIHLITVTNILLIKIQVNITKTNDSTTQVLLGDAETTIGNPINHKFSIQGANR